MADNGWAVAAGVGVSTICIVGFAPEAQARELKNLCRFFPGFQGAHVGFSGQRSTTLFVKFDYPEQAHEAIELVQGKPFDLDIPQLGQLRAEFARREMEVRESKGFKGKGGPTVPAPWHAAPPPRAGGGDYGAWEQGGKKGFKGSFKGAFQGGPKGGYHDTVGAKRPRSGPELDGTELDTIAILGYKEKKLDAEQLHSWFSQQPGFLMLHANERIPAIFVKFETSVKAEAGMKAANDAGFGSEWARRNLDL